MLAVRNLSHAFGSRTAVADLSFTAQSGEIFGLLGPNGAGKTTTLHLISGLLPLQSGSIDIAGCGPPSSLAARAALGLAPQACAFYGELTAHENLAFFGQLYGLSGARLNERIAAVLDLAGLQDRADGRARTFSGGMQRRLNLAIALLHAPRVVLLDEPTAGVDPQSRNHLLERIALLKAQGVALVYTTHYMDEAERLCDRIAIVDQGRILACGTPAQLVREHGGGAAVHVELRYEPPATLTLPGFSGGRAWTFISLSPADDVRELASAGLEFTSLHVEQPSLEAVFLRLTGRRLRD